MKPEILKELTVKTLIDYCENKGIILELSPSKGCIITKKRQFRKYRNYKIIDIRASKTRYYVQIREEEKEEKEQRKEWKKMAKERKRWKIKTWFKHHYLDIALIFEILGLISFIIALILR